jgi:RNA polymerase sigma factor (sigma-70 family)
VVNAETLPAGETGPSDGELVGALAGEQPVARRAWSLLVARHSTRMYAVARSFGVDAPTAEDLVQTAWLRLLDRAHQLRDPQAVGAWLCMIVRNEARRLTVRRREIPLVSPLELRPGVADPADTRLLRDERTAALRTAFARLGHECRQLLQLLLADPALSYDEIAAALGRPRGSLGPTRRRCLDNLRRLLPPGFEP